MSISADSAVASLEKILGRDDRSPAQIAFEVYRILSAAGIEDDDIQNIGAMVTEIASGH